MKRRMKRKLVLPLVAIALLGISGCEENSSKTDETKSSISSTKQQEDVETSSSKIEEQKNRWQNGFRYCTKNSGRADES